MIKSIPSTLPESKSIYYPAPELTSQVSGLSKLIATLIALPHFRAQKPITRLSASAMAFCVMRDGWLSFALTQFSCLCLQETTVIHTAHHAELYIYIYAIKLYMRLPKALSHSHIWYPMLDIGKWAPIIEASSRKVSRSRCLPYHILR